MILTIDISNNRKDPLPEPWQTSNLISNFILDQCKLESSFLQHLLKSQDFVTFSEKNKYPE